MNCSEACESVTPSFQTGSPLVAEPRVSSQRTPERLTESCLPTAGEAWGQGVASCRPPKFLVRKSAEIGRPCVL